MEIMALSSLSIPKGEKVQERGQLDKQGCWDVESLYSSWDAWEGEMKQVGEAQVPHWPHIGAYRNKWQQSPTLLKELIELCLSCERRLSKLHTYAHLRHDEDVASEIPKRAYARITALLHDFRQETAWIEPALLEFPQEKMQAFLRDSSLKDYVIYLEKILRLKAHTLPTAEEELLAKAGMALDAAHRAFGALNNADLQFGYIVDSQGKQRELTHGKYSVYMRDRDRVLRENAFKTLHRAFLGFENTICELLNGQIQAHVFEMRARKYDSSLHAALFPNQIDLKVYESLIKTVRAHLPSLHKYVALRKNVLGLEEMHAYDLHVPLVKEVDMMMSYDEAVEAIIESLSIMGEEYQKVLRAGLTDARWVDRYENVRKRSGAYSSGCYDSMPYILMNYHSTFNDVMTLTHEAGHSMHSFLSRTHQPYQYSQYSIFVAEVASTFHEELLLRHFLKTAQKEEEKIFLINQKIDAIRTTMLRQTLFAEFELMLHRLCEEGAPLTPALLKEEYRKLNEEYYGSEMVQDAEVDIEWARIPHFYYNFYVYQYATGISAAHALVEKVLKGGEAARDKYLAFLSAGSSRYPLDVLQLAGVDMRTAEAVTSTMLHFGELVDTLEAIVKKK
jgi:oligoendopeptidase F